MKHFLDKCRNMSRQVFDQAVITDAKGKVAGKIIIRHTDSQIGWNSETGIQLYNTTLNFNKTIKSDYGNKDAVFTILSSIGCRVYTRDNTRFKTYGQKHDGQMTSGISNPQEFASFKLGKKKFQILWV